MYTLGFVLSFLRAWFAGHASPITTIACTHPSDEELCSRVKGLPC